MIADDEIEMLRNRLRSLETNEAELAEPDLSREIANVSGYVIGVLDRAETSLLSAATGDAIAKVLDQIDQRLVVLGKGTTPAQTRTSNLKALKETDLPKLVPLAAQIPLGADKDAATALANLRADSAEVLAAIQTDADTSIANLRSQVEEERAEAAIATAERLDGLGEQIDSHRATLDGVESDSATLKETLTEIGSEASTTVEAAVTDAANRFKNQSDQMDKDLVAIAEKRREIEELAGALGSHASAYDYIKRADAEQRRADWWAGGGALLLLVTIVLGVIQILKDGSPEVGPAIGRLALALLVGAAATYCFRMSRDHREIQRRYRVAGMQLAALPTFLAPLEPPVRAEIRKQVVPIYFSGPQPANNPPEPLSSDAIAALERLAESAKGTT